jgi:hypothetical protein
MTRKQSLRSIAPTRTIDPALPPSAAECQPDLAVIQKSEATKDLCSLFDVQEENKSSR